MEPDIQAHRKIWHDKFNDKQLKMEARQCTAIWDAALVQGFDRELSLYFLVVISDEVDAVDKPKSAFVKGALWRRRALPTLVAPLARSEYFDWARHVPVYDRGNLSSSAEKRQACSGVPLYTAVLREAFHGLNVSQNHSCHVRDWSPRLSVSVCQLSGTATLQQVLL